jgi:SAM-dependent methyltransferase
MRCNRSRVRCNTKNGRACTSSMCHASGRGDDRRPCISLDWLSDQSFDNILCALAFDYVEDLAPVLREFRRVARQGSTLVFSMALPMRDWMDARTHGEGTYFTTSRFGLYWSGFGEPKPYAQAYRRPLSDILNGNRERLAVGSLCRTSTARRDADRLGTLARGALTSPSILRAALAINSIAFPYRIDR